MHYFVGAVLVLVAAIHLMPLLGVLGVPRLMSLYGITLTDQSLEILMRHRAVLFGLLGAFLLYAAFQVELRTIALFGGFVSVASFVGLAWIVGDYNGALSKVVVIDVLALVLLVAAGIVHVLLRGDA